MPKHIIEVAYENIWKAFHISLFASIDRFDLVLHFVDDQC